MLFEGSVYRGTWQECGPHESLAYSELSDFVTPAEGKPSPLEVARNTHRAFFTLQREDGQLRILTVRPGLSPLCEATGASAFCPRLGAIRTNSFWRLSLCVPVDTSRYLVNKVRRSLQKHRKKSTMPPRKMVSMLKNPCDSRSAFATKFLALNVRVPCTAPRSMRETAGRCGSWRKSLGAARDKRRLGGSGVLRVPERFKDREARLGDDALLILPTVPGGLQGSLYGNEALVLPETPPLCDESGLRGERKTFQAGISAPRRLQSRAKPGQGGRRTMRQWQTVLYRASLSGSSPCSIVDCSASRSSGTSCMLCSSWR